MQLWHFCKILLLLFNSNFASCLVMVFEHALVLDSYQIAGSFMVRQRRGALCFDEDK